MSTISWDKKNKKSAGTITIHFDKLPSNCSECPMYEYTYDEDACWGDGMRGTCFFDCSRWGNLVERPKDCPIKKGDL